MYRNEANMNVGSVRRLHRHKYAICKIIETKNTGILMKSWKSTQQNYNLHVSEELIIRLTWFQQVILTRKQFCRELWA